MYDLDTIRRMNNESGEHLTGEAQTLADIQNAARIERNADATDAVEAKRNADTGDEGYAKAQREVDAWNEPRNEC